VMMICFTRSNAQRNRFHLVSIRRYCPLIPRLITFFR
jgi:hypothetical protein